MIIPKITVSDKFLSIIKDGDAYEPEDLNHPFEDFQAFHAVLDVDDDEYSRKRLYLEHKGESLLVVKGYVHSDMLAAQTLDGKRVFIGASYGDCEDFTSRYWVEV